MAKPRKKRASRVSKRLLLQLVEQDREAFTRIVEAVCPETFALGQSGATRKEFGEAAGHIARVQIDQSELAAYIYERIHDKSVAMVREMNRPHIRPRPALPGSGADELALGTAVQPRDVFRVHAALGREHRALCNQ